MCENILILTVIHLLVILRELHPDSLLISNSLVCFELMVTPAKKQMQ